MNPLGFLRRLGFLAVPLAVVLAPIEARADESNEQPATSWYGWQTLIIDLGSHAAATGAIVASGGDLGGGKPSTTQYAIAFSWLGAYVLGAPIVHAAHGHWDRAGISIAMRAGGWLVLGFAGAGVGGMIDRSDGVGTGAAIGVLAGIVTPIVLDATILSKEKTATKPRDATFTPTAGVTPSGGGLVGAYGTF
jgi:hypothetical protein